MTKFVKIAKVQDIPPGERLWHDFEEESVIVFNVGGDITAGVLSCGMDTARNLGTKDSQEYAFWQELHQTNCRNEIGY